MQRRDKSDEARGAVESADITPERASAECYNGDLTGDELMNVFSRSELSDDNSKMKLDAYQDEVSQAAKNAKSKNHAAKSNYHPKKANQKHAVSSDHEFGTGSQKQQSSKLENGPKSTRSDNFKNISGIHEKHDSLFTNGNDSTTKSTNSCGSTLKANEKELYE